MNRDAYLERIGYHGPLDPSHELLRDLHRHHLHSVPFENLEIALGRPFELSLPALFDKVVGRRRGGFCYELNGLFGWLLGELGFEVEMLAGRVFNGPVLGPPFDHMLLLVRLDERWIADVGFGDSFIEPLLFGSEVGARGEGRYRFVGSEGDWVLEKRDSGRTWHPQYLFSLEPRRLEDFTEMCRYHQTSPLSPFTQKSLCTLATPEGRVTFSQGRRIVTTHGEREESRLTDVDDLRAFLDESFGVVLDGTEDLVPLLHRGEG